MTVVPGQANVITVDAVAKASGDPITSGTVNVYLRAKDGANAGKWYRGSDTSWQGSEVIAGAASHTGDGHWDLSLPSAVWTAGVAYNVYPKESGGLHTPYSEPVFCENKTGYALSSTQTFDLTGNITGNLSGSIGSLATQAKADVNAEADTALSDINLDHLLAVACPSNLITNAVVDHSVFAKFLADNGNISGWDDTQETMQNIYLEIDALNDLSSAQVGAELRAINLDHLMIEPCEGNNITNAVGDHTVIAKMLADSGDISDWSGTTDTMEDIYNKIAALVGAGARTYTLTIYEDDGATPIDGASVWVTTDSAGANHLAGTETSNASGVVTFYLDDGTVYFWTQKAGWNFTNPTSATVASGSTSSSISATGAADSPTYTSAGLTAAQMVDRIEEEMGWISPTSAQSAQALQWLNDGYRRFLRGEYIDLNTKHMKIHPWSFLRPSTTLTAWTTVTGKVSGSPTHAGGSSTITATAAKFYASMVGRSFVFDTSGTSYTITTYTSSTVIKVSGDASGETADDTFAITPDGRYGLPDTFGGLIEAPAYVYDGSSCVDIQEISQEEMDIKLRDSTSQSTAKYCCVLPRATPSQSSTGQQWDLLLYPFPSITRTLRIRYRVQVSGLTDAATYPPGGQDHCDTILCAALSAMEASKNVHNGPWETEYQERMNASVPLDDRLYDDGDTKRSMVGRGER